MNERAGSPVVETRLWDLPTRLFHWALVVLVATSWGLGEFGPDIMTLHFWSGYAICGLLAFRLVWGLVGPRPARFASFLYGPRKVLAYAAGLSRRQPSRWPGHNPLGGWAVAALLLLLVAQVATGLVADPEDFVNVGPFASAVGADLSRTATALHETLSSLILLMVALHVGVILFYRHWKREDLIGPMIHGRKAVDPSAEEALSRSAPPR
ncbi:cytochrome b/b6 domain-containing protein [Paralimibaculum aggregatum]|uniref:Cytochrome b/b6 domain-containing protein n=1 Tax=Paralimibaculum aggregatum TaxID=3036245 RepID=A0ABQ6LPK3_9RHOB|nr:cytochrome b/b6 domain-containing protein [Limibaculum sp. NKW23]GMG83707.1 cytochrome b/b6 domain-containing protein [Limibaculum sp. NKW23]